MKQRVTDDCLELLRQIEPQDMPAGGATVMERWELYEWLRQRGVYVTVEYDPSCDFNCWHYRVQWLENMSRWSYNAFGHDDYSRAFDAGLEYALAALLDEKKAKAAAAERERQRKAGELVTRKQAELAFFQTYNAIAHDEHYHTAEGAAKIFQANLDDILKRFPQ